MRADAMNSRINRRYQTCLSKASAWRASAQFLHENPEIVETLSDGERLDDCLSHHQRLFRTRPKAARDAAKFGGDLSWTRSLASSGLGSWEAPSPAISSIADGGSSVSTSTR